MLSSMKHQLNKLHPEKISFRGTTSTRSIPLILPWVLFTAGLGAPKAVACASCGSGGGDPLILYPNEDLKFYFSLGHQKVEKEVSAASKRDDVYGPKQKTNALLSLGLRLHYDLFTTFTTGLQFNQREGHKGQGVVDPSLLFRYTIVNQTFEKPWYPQIQGVLGYKHAQGTSIHSSKEPDLVDVTSSGYSDIKIGFDVWYGMHDIRGGIAYLRLISLPRKESDGSKNENGLTHRWTATLGYQLSAMFKVTGGLNRQTTEARRYQGSLVDDSEIQDHSAFVNLDFMGYESQSVRLGYVQSALLPTDRLTTQTQSMTLAFLFSL